MSGFDQTLVYLLNGWLGSSASAFSSALHIVDRFPWLLGIVLLVGFWFAGERSLVPTRSHSRTQFQNRCHVVGTLIALIVALLIAQAIQHQIFRPRPLTDLSLAIPMPANEWTTIRDSLVNQSSFPSLYAVMAFVIITQTFAVNRIAGAVALLLYTYIGALQIGLGFFWPSDFLAGALLGTLITTVSLILIGRTRRSLETLLLWLDYRPIIMYSLGFLIMLDMSQKFWVLFGALKVILGNAIHRL
jgi:hypothetical protein